MKKMTTTLFALAASIVLIAMFTGVGQSSSAQSSSNPCGPMDSASVDAPKIIAIKFHADWCGYCKAMGPVFEELQAKFDREPVLYVTFDQTRDFDRKQSRYMAHAMGLDSVWKEHGGKTGFVLLIDTKTHKVIQKLTHEQNIKQMGAAIQKAVASSS